jgi:deferrochelatase/peroxidase EfeB
MLVGCALMGVGAGLENVIASGSKNDEAIEKSPGQSLSVYGTHQVGIATPAQDCLHFAAFDVTSGAADGLRSILEEWTAAAARLTAGKPFGPPTEALDEPPVDTGEAIGLGPERLTVTIGLGPSVFSSAGREPSCV